jgi:uncharacterized protein YndB with AHSA1/START domain
MTSRPTAPFDEALDLVLERIVPVPVARVWAALDQLVALVRSW